MGIQQLREERQGRAREMRRLLDNHPGKSWGEEQQKAYDEHTAEITRIDAEIERNQRLLDLEAEQRFAAERAEGQAKAERDGRMTDAQRYAKVFDQWLRGGDRSVSAEDAAFAHRHTANIRAAMSSGTGDEGGYLVPTEFGGRLIEAMKAFGGMRSVANVITTAGGNDIEYPTTDATAEEGEIVAENAEVSDEDPTFGIKTVKAYKYSSKGIAVPFELLQDSGINLEAHIVQRLGQRLGRITNRHFTTGTGTNQPEGVVTAAGAGVTAGLPTSLAIEDLLDLEHSVDPAYREQGNCRYMFHDSTLLLLKKLKDGDQRPIWVPGYTEGEPDRISGYEYTINQHMPVVAAEARAVLFGDFRQYMIRDVMQFLFFRMTDSAYTRKGQVGFLAFSRHDGKLLDANAVKALTMAA